jgi:hypothetical protein
MTTTLLRFLNDKEFALITEEEIRESIKPPFEDRELMHIDIKKGKYPGIITLELEDSLFDRRYGEACLGIYNSMGRGRFKDRFIIVRKSKKDDSTIGDHEYFHALFHMFSTEINSLNKYTDKGNTFVYEQEELLFELKDKLAMLEEEIYNVSQLQNIRHRQDSALADLKRRIKAELRKKKRSEWVHKTLYGYGEDIWRKFFHKYRNELFAYGSQGEAPSLAQLGFPSLDYYQKQENWEFFNEDFQYFHTRLYPLVSKSPRSLFVVCTLGLVCRNFGELNKMSAIYLIDEYMHKTT